MNLHTALNFINSIYESEYFPKILLFAIIFLIVLFAVVLILGLKDAKRSKEPKKEVEEDIKDITFNMTNDTDVAKEDVTFEMPVLTKNLEDFKKNLEEEIQKESKINILTPVGELPKKQEKPQKILDIKTIEDTAIIPVLTPEVIEKYEVERLEETKQLEKLEEEPQYSGADNF